MKHILKLSLFILFLAVVFRCETKKESIDTSKNIKPKIEHSITIFGSENCDHCIAFRKSVDSVAVSYIFKDVEANEQYYNELLQKIQVANYKGYVSFPVLDIDGKLYVKPEFGEFMKIIGK